MAQSVKSKNDKMFRIFFFYFKRSGIAIIAHKKTIICLEDKK